jgi:hypothetical protein
MGRDAYQHVTLQHFEYPLGESTRWARIGDIVLTAHVPSGCRSHGVFLDDFQESHTRTRFSGTDGPSGNRTEVHAWPGGRLSIVNFGMSCAVERHYGWWGGLFVGVGAKVSVPATFRMRMGYEMALSPLLVYSLVVDSDFRNAATVAPALEVTAPWSFVAPAVGLGAAVRVLPERALGVRAQAALQFRYVGVVASVDMYPSQMGEAGGDGVDALVLGRLSF